MIREDYYKRRQETSPVFFFYTNTIRKLYFALIVDFTQKMKYNAQKVNTVNLNQNRKKWR